MSNNFTIIKCIEELNSMFAVVTGKPYVAGMPKDQQQKTTFYVKTDKGAVVIDGARMRFECDCDGPILPHIYEATGKKGKFPVVTKRPSLKLIIDSKKAMGDYSKRLYLMTGAAYIFTLDGLQELLPHIWTLEYRDNGVKDRSGKIIYEAMCLTKDLKLVPLWDVIEKVPEAEIGKFGEALTKNFVEDSNNKRFNFKQFNYEPSKSNGHYYMKTYLNHDAYPVGSDGKPIRGYLKDKEVPTPAMQDLASWGLSIPKLVPHPTSPGNWGIERNSNWVYEKGTACHAVVTKEDHCYFFGRVDLETSDIGLSPQGQIYIHYRARVWKFPQPSNFGRKGGPCDMDEIDTGIELENNITMGSVLAGSAAAASGSPAKGTITVNDDE